MARKNNLSVIVEANLASDVTKKLNGEIERLKLENAEVGLTVDKDFDKDFKKEFKQSIANAIEEVLKIGGYDEGNLRGLGKKLATFIASGIGDGLSDDVVRQIENITKSAVSSAKKTIAAEKEVQKTIKETSDISNSVSKSDANSKAELKNKKEQLEVTRQINEVSDEAAKTNAKIVRDIHQVNNELTKTLNEISSIKSEISDLEKMSSEAFKRADLDPNLDPNDESFFDNPHIKESDRLSYEADAKRIKLEELEEKRDELFKEQFSMNYPEIMEIVQKNANNEIEAANKSADAVEKAEERKQEAIKETQGILSNLTKEDIDKIDKSKKYVAGRNDKIGNLLEEITKTTDEQTVNELTKKVNSEKEKRNKKLKNIANLFMERLEEDDHEFYNRYRLNDLTKYTKHRNLPPGKENDAIRSREEWILQHSLKYDKTPDGYYKSSSKVDENKKKIDSKYNEILESKLDDDIESKLAELEQLIIERNELMKEYERLSIEKSKAKDEAINKAREDYYKEHPEKNKKAVEIKEQELETTNAIADAQSKVSDSQKELQDVSQESLKIEEKKQDIVEKSADKQNEAIKENFEQLGLFNDQQKKAAENQAKNAEQQTENINKQTDALKEQEKVSESLLENIAPEPTKSEQEDDVPREDFKDIEKAADAKISSEEKIQDAISDTEKKREKSLDLEDDISDEINESTKNFIEAEEAKQKAIEETEEKQKNAVKTYKDIYNNDGELVQESVKYDFKNGKTKTVDTYHTVDDDGNEVDVTRTTEIDKTQELAWRESKKAIKENNKELEKTNNLYDEVVSKFVSLQKQLGILKAANPDGDFTSLEQEFEDIKQNVLDYDYAIKHGIEDTDDLINLQNKMSSTKNNMDVLKQTLEERNKLEAKVIEDSINQELASREEKERLAKEQYDNEYELAKNEVEEEKKLNREKEQARQNQLRETESSYNDVRKTVDDLYNYAGNFRVFTKDDVESISRYESELEDIYKILKKDSATTEEFAKAQERLAYLQSDAQNYAAGLKHRADVDKELVREEKKLREEQIKEENRLQKEYNETKQAAYESISNARRMFSGNQFQSDGLDRAEKTLNAIIRRLESGEINAEQFYNAIKRINSLKTNVDLRFNLDDKLDKELEKIENNLDIKTVKLNSRFGELFNESKLRSFYDITGEINKELAKAEPSWKNIQKLIDKANKNAQKYEAELAAAAKRTKEIEEETQLLDSSLGRFVQFYWFGEIFRAGKTAVTEMASAVTTLDSSMVELKKVTEETEDTYSRFLDKASGKAKELGITMSDYVDSVTNFARMGYDFTESQTIAETANIMQMVSENMTADEASEYMISIMAGFGIEAENTLDIVDKLNNVSNNFSITTDGLGEALKRSSAAMASANNSLEETLSLTAAANEVIQNPETVGNALKTISMNFVALHSNVYRKTYLKRGMLNVA
jgi:hypothetical protein